MAPRTQLSSLTSNCLAPARLSPAFLLAALLVALVPLIQAEIYWENCDFEVNGENQFLLDSGQYNNLCIRDHVFESLDQPFQFAEATIQGSTFKNCIFTNNENNINNFTLASWTDVQFDSCTFGSSSSANNQVVFRKTALSNVQFSNCVFDGSIELVFSEFDMRNVIFDGCHFKANTVFELGQISGVTITNSRVQYSDNPGIPNLSTEEKALTFRHVTMEYLSLLENTFVDYPLRFEGVNAAFVSINESSLAAVECDSDDRYVDEASGDISVLRSRFNDTILFDNTFNQKFRCPSTVFDRVTFLNLSFLHDVDLAFSTLNASSVDTLSQRQAFPEDGVECRVFNFSYGYFDQHTMANVSIDCEGDFQNTTFEQVRVVNFFARSPNFRDAVFKRQEYVDGVCCSIACRSLGCLCDVPSPSGTCPSGDKSVNTSSLAREGAHHDSCFPSSAMVHVEGASVRMDRVSKQHALHLPASGSNPSVRNSIFFFGHRNARESQKYLALSYGHVDVHDSERGVLKISHGHYLYVNGVLQVARNVRAGDMLRSGVDNRDSVQVTAVDTVVLTGIHSPVTTHGDLVVDGIVVSSYTDAIDRRLAARLLWPVKTLHRLGFDSLISRVEKAFEMDSLGYLARKVGIPKGAGIAQ